MLIKIQLLHLGINIWSKGPVTAPSSLVLKWGDISLGKAQKHPTEQPWTFRVHSHHLLEFPIYNIEIRQKGLVDGASLQALGHGVL